MSKRAIILAGGKGTRLKPYSIALPKPLVPVGETPILEIIIKQLISYGFDHITLAVNHMADIIEAFFGDGAKWNIKIDYSLEETPLSTMGPLTLIDNLPDNFLIMNGDILTDLDFNRSYKNHVDNGNTFTISSYKREQVNEYGVLEVDQDSRLTGFSEKPRTQFIVSMGIYMASKSILKYIPYNTAYGFDHLMLDLLADKKTISVEMFEGYWLDIGRPDDYERACNDIDNIIE